MGLFLKKASLYYTINAATQLNGVEQEGAPGTTLKPDVRGEKVFRQLLMEAMPAQRT